ncbi:MAG: N-acetylmuramoyl-L-alanine amidase [Turicibacter sp.]|nr:N-acetylmuramoyl-L-alanine amidase [Turicibacter sp.]
MQKISVVLRIMIAAVVVVASFFAVAIFTANTLFYMVDAVEMPENIDFVPESNSVTFAEMYRYLENYHGIVLSLETLDLQEFAAFRGTLDVSGRTVILYINAETGKEFFRIGDSVSTDYEMVGDTAEQLARIDFGEIYRYLEAYHGTVLTLEIIESNNTFRAKLAIDGEGIILYIQMMTGEELHRVEGLTLTAEESRIAERRKPQSMYILTPVYSDYTGRFVVIIDPGHGGSRPGAVHGGIRESHLNLAVAQRVVSLIENNPHIVAYMTRNSDIDIGLRERSNFGNAHGNLFVSIHHNAANNRNVHGIETFFANSGSNIDFASASFAQIMQRNLIEHLGSYDRGVKSRRFAVLRRSQIPAVLVELGFMSNQSEFSRIRTEEFQNRAAYAIYNGILEAFWHER